MEEEKLEGWEELVIEELERCKEDETGFYLVDSAGNRFYWWRK